MGYDIAALKAKVDIAAVVGHYVALKKRGHEYVGLCIAHNDHNPSMWVSPVKGIVHCFSCGFSVDVIGFIEHVEGLTFKAAVERLNGGAPVEWTPKISVEKTKPVAERVTSKPPEGVEPPDMAIRALGNPSRIWPYRDADGGIIGYVARYETPEGKQIRCWTWGARGDAAPSWGCGHWSPPRPIYNLDRLAANPQAPVLVVEGEKAADAAAALLPSYTVTAWPGGAQAWHKAEWGALRGRKVLLWPDNDRAGIECMDKLAAVLSDPRGLACSVRLIDPNRMPEGWDAADWTGSTEELIAWAKPRARDYAAPHKEAEQSPDQESESPAPQEPATGAPQSPPVDATGEPMPEPAFPPEALKTRPEKPSKRRASLKVVGGVTVDIPSPEDAPLPVSMSEDAIADAFAEEHEKDWRYVAQWGHWLRWEGDGWRRDMKELIDRLAVEMCRRAVTWTDAVALTPDAKRRLGQRKTAGAVRDMARHDRRIAASADGWDADPMLVGVPGGVFDVRTGKLIEGEREQYITRCTAVAPEAGEPAIWLSHLRRMMAGDAGMIDFLQLFAGYCATGDISEQCFIFLYGMGQTGKGTFLLTLYELLGSYAAQSSASTFMDTHNERHSSEIARLQGYRLIVIDETEATARWNEERIKRMTGGGRITAALKYEDESDIRVTWKLAFAGNHKPSLRGVGKEMERRIRLVKCNESIPDGEVNRRFRENMIATEGPQILNWILQGAVRWNDSGLTLPEQVSDATREYLDAEDTIGDWLAENCEQKGEIKRPQAYHDYADWAVKRGDRPWSNRAWWAAMESHGYSARKTGGAWFVIGLSLKNPLAGEHQHASRYPD